MFETEVGHQSTGSRTYTQRDYAIWLASMLAVSISGALLSGYFSWKDARVAKREQTVVGTITSLGASARGGTANGFRFLVGRATYEGTESQSELRPGDVVTVYFDPEDPSTSSLTDFNSSSKMKHNFMIFTAFISVGLALVLVHLVRELPTNYSPDS
jgi:Protein of unknown function (DUF3592)